MFDLPQLLKNTNNTLQSVKQARDEKSLQSINHKIHTHAEELEKTALEAIDKVSHDTARETQNLISHVKTIKGELEKASAQQAALFYSELKILEAQIQTILNNPPKSKSGKVEATYKPKSS